MGNFSEPSFHFPTQIGGTKFGTVGRTDDVPAFSRIQQLPHRTFLSAWVLDDAEVIAAKALAHLRVDPRWVVHPLHHFPGTTFRQTQDANGYEIHARVKANTWDNTWFRARLQVRVIQARTRQFCISFHRHSDDKRRSEDCTGVDEGGKTIKTD